jgi:hypothetical protein
MDIKTKKIIAMIVANNALFPQTQNGWKTKTTTK